MYSEYQLFSKERVKLVCLNNLNRQSNLNESLNKCELITDIENRKSSQHALFPFDSSAQNMNYIIISEQIRSIGEHEIFINPYIYIKESILIKVLRS